MDSGYSCVPVRPSAKQQQILASLVESHVWRTNLSHCICFTLQGFQPSFAVAGSQACQSRPGYAGEQEQGTSTYNHSAYHTTKLMYLLR